MLLFINSGAEEFFIWQVVVHCFYQTSFHIYDRTAFQKFSGIKNKASQKSVKSCRISRYCTFDFQNNLFLCLLSSPCL